MTIKIFYAPYGSKLGKGGTLINENYFLTSEHGSWYSADWIVAGISHSCFYTNIPKERRILFITEPPEITDYAQGIYYPEQFGIIISPYNIKGFKGKTIISNPKLGWTAGKRNGAMISLQDALDYPIPEKSRNISIITSLKHNTVYHKKRVKFLRAAQKYFGSELDCFGREFNPVDDKLDAVAPYKYHIAIENSRIPNYWTEKLTDAWTGWALPIYCGDPTILEQIPDRNGIEIIDVANTEEALKKIRRIIDEDIYSSRIEAIRKCREWALRESDGPAAVCRIIEQSQDNTPKLKTPELFKILLSRRKNYVYNFLKKISGNNYADKIFEAYCRHKGRFWE